MVRKNIKVNVKFITVIIVITILYVSNIYSYVVSFDEYKDVLVGLRYIDIFITILLSGAITLLVFKKSLLYIVSFFMLTLLYALLSRNYFYVDVALLILFSFSLTNLLNNGLEKALDITSFIILVTFIIIVYFALNGALENDVFIMPTTHYFPIKLSLGFNNPNVISMLICTFAITLLFYKRWMLFALYSIAFLPLSLLLGSRTYILAWLVSIIISIFYDKFKKVDIALYAILFIPVLIAVSLYYNISSDLVLYLDRFLNGRVAGFFKEIKDYNLLQFLIGGGSFTKVDVAYFNFILGYGIIGYTAIMYTLVRLLRSCKGAQLLKFSYSLLFICFFENTISVNSILSVAFIIEIILYLNQNRHRDIKNANIKFNETDGVISQRNKLS
ncbi:hypothetical protein [Vibrio gallicus]|uniref:hypothetical protein n=1 Tax=Vibrio gallicus TaxID=190897 RepID=UPI0021C44720|nr:hypothetical protein [Vibrio gallicus]